MKRKWKLPALVLALVLLLDLAAGAAYYAGIFSRRMSNQVTDGSELARYPGLFQREIPFVNGDGVSLMGWLYTAVPSEETAPKGLLVLVHGMGTGHLPYLNEIDCFARQGWLVFAYDASGYGASGGDETKGFPQAVLDLDAALNAAAALPEAAGLPVCLFGHSLGAHAACAVLMRHPEVRAVAALAGFDDLSSLAGAKFGLPGLLLLPGAALWERLRFGEAAAWTAQSGFAASEARILIVHSADDKTVPIACGLDRYQAAWGEDPRFNFLRLEDRGHSGVFTPEVEAACLELFREACE